MQKELSDAFIRLVTIMDELREKCPWDQKQTIESLRPMTIEETYELGEAILKKDWQHIKEELGDLLLHIVFYASIGKEENAFTMQSVIESLIEKLIVRHPHIYGEVTVKDEEEVKRNWEQIKLLKGNTSVLSGVPAGLPALVKATRIQEKVKQVGFEWEVKEQVYEKIQEELGELQEAIKDGEQSAIESELGDVLFSVVNYARFLGVDADSALERTNQKFMHRFRQMESLVQQEGRQLKDMTLAELDALWARIKKNNA
ncbi:MAG: nucleoside triphosphate pyrophosphohydrolase [Bacteroidetes bacterium]|nr:nucleoside triphosphate pyrophosphohydrolase [Bacteroidota bacterium]